MKDEDDITTQKALSHAGIVLFVLLFMWLLLGFFN